MPTAGPDKGPYQCNMQQMLMLGVTHGNFGATCNSQGIQTALINAMKYSLKLEGEHHTTVVRLPKYSAPARDYQRTN